MNNMVVFFPVRILFAFAMVLSCLVLPFGSAVAEDGGRFALETDTFRYEVGSDARNLSLFDKTGGVEYCKREEGIAGVCANVTKNGEVYPATAATLDHGVVKLEFAGSGVKADVKVVAEGKRLVFEVGEVLGEPDEFVFVNIPLTLEAKPYEPFAACALALNPFTHVHQIPALHTAYWAECTHRFGLTGAKAAVIGVPQTDILPVIRETMKRDADGIPISDKGGAWGLVSEDGYGSYVMNFGTLTEDTVDEWIASCKMLGFNQIECHGGGFFHFGSLDCQLPGGWQSFRRVVDKCHAAGIKVTLLTYTCYINQNARYVTPVPHPDLDTWRDWTLAASVSEDADEIEVREPVDASTEEGWLVASNRTLRIGNEIIRYAGVTKEAPWKFTGCERGYHGTKPAAHDGGSKASLIKTYWNGLYVPRPDSALWYEIAKNHADVINQCGFDGLYFDAIEGLQYMWGRENYWYYGGKFAMDVAKDLERPVGMEFAGMIHNWWRYNSRYEAWDIATRGYKRFVDIHFASLKAGEETQHGYWLGHDPEIDKYAGMKDCGLFLPFQLGWWSIPAWGSPKTEPMYHDDMDYICAKLLGNNSGFSFNRPVMPGEVAANPFLKCFVDKLRECEEARRSKVFDEGICAELRKPGREFRLKRTDGGDWKVQRMSYRRHKVVGIGHPTAKWTVENEFPDQPVGLRIVPFYSPASYDDPEGMVRYDASVLAGNYECTGNRGVSGRLVPNAGTVPATGENAMEFSATNSGEVPADAAWVHTPIYTAPKEWDMDGNRLAIGVWICGDGQGEAMNIMTGTCSQLVTIDFTGWRYFELLEADSTAISHYSWPPMGYSIYTHYHDVAKLGECRIWLNNIPVGKTVDCRIGPVKALPFRENEFNNPEVSVNGSKIRFPATLKTGMYIEMLDGKCVLYSETGAPLGEIEPLDPVPVLRKGTNEISVTTESKLPTNARMEVTVIGEGEDL